MWNRNTRSMGWTAFGMGNCRVVVELSLSPLVENAKYKELMQWTMKINFLVVLSIILSFYFLLWGHKLSQTIILNLLPYQFLKTDEVDGAVAVDISPFSTEAS